MKRPKLIALGLSGLVVVGLLVFAIPTIWGKPWSIEHFYTRVFLKFALEHPMLLSRMRILEPMGLSFHNDDLDRFDVQAVLDANHLVEDALETLESYDRDSLEDQLSYDVLHWFLAIQKQGARFAFHNYPVNQTFGLQSSLPDFMINTHRIDDREGAEDYITRCAKFKPAFAQIIESLTYRQKKGIVPPRFVIQKTLDQVKRFIEPSVEQHALCTHFKEQTAKLTELSQQDRQELLTDLKRTLEEAVYPAYRSLVAYLESLKKVASDDDGVWKLPDGQAYYAWTLQHHTSTTMSAEQLHELGLREVNKIQKEMQTILEQQGYQVESVGKTMQALNKEARFLYPDSDEGRKQILADYQKIIDEIDAGLDPLFSLRPKSSVKVDRIPAFSEKTAPGAYYSAPPLDGSKPGRFFVNLRSVEEIPKFSMRTLAYHEAIPGHHFQIAIAQELKNVPFFRKVIPFTAYAEGWALYAERLAAEHGFQKDPFDRLGYLTADLFRSCRLVVDTGIHHKRWTRQQAIQYMLESTGMPQTDVVAEIERYIVNPGQACAYKVGQLKILALRDKAKTKLGDRFDLKEFHRVLLSHGAIPLTLLEQLVDSWIEAELKA